MVEGFAVGRADVSGVLSVDIRIGKVLPPPPPEVVIVDAPAPPGPPPWAGHHWFTRERAYYYYPDAEVYYRPADHMWFYLDGGAWQAGASLPARIDFDLSHCVSLTLATSRPYLYHRQVVTFYARDYFHHVRIKGDHDDAREHGNHDDDRRGGPGPGPDENHGKGKGHDKSR